MHTYRFGRKLKLPSKIAIKHQIRKLISEDSVKKQRQLVSPFQRRIAISAGKMFLRRQRADLVMGDVAALLGGAHELLDGRVR
jgi:hypothetical protein